MHPEQQLGVERPVVAPLDPRVDLVDAAGRRKRSLAIAEHDRHRHEDRPAQPAQRMRAKVRVLVHPRRHFRMRHLHEQRPPASKEQNVLAVDPPGDRILAVKARLHNPIKPL
jgi:hypothetical protein